jgi:hypothetical protein
LRYGRPDKLRHDLRDHPIVRALAEYAYSLIVPDLTRPAWYVPALSADDNLPARMKALDLILQRPGSLIWESPPRPSSETDLTSAQRDLQLSIGHSAIIFCERFQHDPVAMMALVAIVMAWGAPMPPCLRTVMARLESDSSFLLERSEPQQSLYKELLMLSRIYQPGQFVVASTQED